MGNVLEHESSGSIEDADVIEDDLKWLAVKGSMVFNDDFLEEEYSSLPHYDDTEDPGDNESTGALSADANEPFPEYSTDLNGGMRSDDTLRRMLQLLGPHGSSNSAAAVGAETGQGVRGTSVEDFPILLAERYLRLSTHATAARMRSRLFQRMHLAVLRQAYRSMNSPERAGENGGVVSTALSTFALPPAALTQESAEEDPAAILTSASMRMSLTLMNALRGSCPGLFVSMSKTLMDLFGKSAPFALGKLGSSSAYLDTLSQLRKVAEDVASAGESTPKEDRAQAISLLLSLGIATGSVSDIVCVAKRLLEGDAPSLPPSAKPFVRCLKNHSLPPNTSIPRPHTWTSSFSVRLDDGKEENRPGQRKAAAVAAACNPATDGVHLYIWEPSSRAILKVGTGFHGTLSGNVYCSRKSILDEIRAYKGMEPAREEEEDMADEDEDDDSPREERITEAGLTVQAGGVIISEAAAVRRRSMMGTGLNIGGRVEEEEESDDETDSYVIRDDNEESIWAPLNDPAIFGYASAGGQGGNQRTHTMPSQAPGGLLRGTEYILQSAGAVDGINTSGNVAYSVEDNASEGRQLGIANGENTGTISSGRDNTPSPRGRSPPDARLHRVPIPITPPLPPIGIAVAAAARMAELAAGGGSTGERGSEVSQRTPSRSRDDSPLRTLDDILGSMHSRIRERREEYVRVSREGRMGEERQGSGVNASRAGLIVFKVVEGRPLLHQVPDSGHPDDFNIEPSSDIQLVEVDDEGELWSHKVVHGFRWFKVRMLHCAHLNEPWSGTSVGWLPLFMYEGIDVSDMGSMTSEDRAELGEEEEQIVNLMDPVTGDTIAPDSTRARNPPTWDGDEIPRTVGGEQTRDALQSVGSSSNVFRGRERSKAIRPVWLAFAGGKIFLREKASGALSAHELAVLRPSDLSLESILSLADLPLPGFPSTSDGSAIRGARNGDQVEDKANQRDSGDVLHSSNALDTDRPGEDDLVEFADAATGAVVARCSSNSDTSGGVLQNNLLVRDPLQRQPFPTRNSSMSSSDADVAFSFAPGDTDRIIEVNLGRCRFIREIGIELVPTPGVAFADVVGSLVVEVAVNEGSWTTVGQWNTPDQSGGGGTGLEEGKHQEGEASHSVRVVAEARFVRYSLALPRGTHPAEGPPACLLSRLTVRGLSRGPLLGSMVGDEEEEMPFPAMTTDSRHIILVHATSEGSAQMKLGYGDKDKEETGEDSADAANGNRLELFFLDPLDAYRLVKTVSVKWDIDETCLHKHGVLCDGGRLIMLGPQHEEGVKRTPDTPIVRLRCSCGQLRQSAAECDGVGTTETFPQHEDMEFEIRPTGGLAPHGLGYDRRNNIMWGWDPVLKKLCRWRNDGMSPVLNPPRPTPRYTQRASADSAAFSGGVRSVILSTTEKDATDVSGGEEAGQTPDADLLADKERCAWIRALLSSSSPAHRVEGLEKAGQGCEIGDGVNASLLEDVTAHPTREAALLLGYLERLGESYGPPEEAAAEARVRCELEAASGGHEDGNFSRLLVRGEDWSCREAGMNVLVLSDDLDSSGEIAKGFALQESPHAANRLTDYLNHIPIGRTVMIAVQNDAAGNLRNSAKRALLSVGAGRVEVAALGLNKHASFAMIGRKGATPGSVPQVLRLTKKGCATVRQRLPPPKVPMCVDVSKHTIHSLVTLILHHESVLLQPDSCSVHASPSAPSPMRAPGDEGGVGVPMLDIKRAVVLSAVNILTNQIFQLLRGTAPAQALEVFSPDHLTRLLSLLLAVIDQDQPSPSDQQQEEEQTVDIPEQPQENQVRPPPSSTSSTRGIMAAGSNSSCPVLQPSNPTNKSGKNSATISNVRTVLCQGKRLVDGGVAKYANDSVGWNESTMEGQAEERRTQQLLQNACLRLFVTGMDVFYPTCEQRCSLLVRYLTKYLRDGLSLARQTVLELLLRRMSDPGQLVELMAQPSSSPRLPVGLPASAGFSINPIVNNTSDPMHANSNLTNSSTNDTVGGVTDALAGASGTLVKTSGGRVGASVTHSAHPEMCVGFGSPAPSPMELQSLLLNVATAEGVARINSIGLSVALRVRNEGGVGLGGVGRQRTGDGSLSGGVGEAAVEMLGRLTNQLLSSVACIIMESDDVDGLEAFNSKVSSEDLGVTLAAAGVPPFPASPTTSADTSATSTAMHATGGAALNLSTDVNRTFATMWPVGSGENPPQRDMDSVTILVVLVTALCRSCAALAAKAVKSVDMLMAEDSAQCSIGVIVPELDQLLQESPLGALLPTLASSLTLLVDKHGSKFQSRLSGLAQELVRVMKWVSEVLKRVPKERREITTGGSRSVGKVKKTVVMESKHRYEANTDELHELYIAGATRITITFDPRSSTEHNYDFVKFWKEEQRRSTLHPEIEKFSGSGSSCNFPGFDGRPPLTIESNRAFVQWSTDQSNEDWGWKFTATAEVGKPSSGGDGGGHWLLGLDRELAGAGAALAGCLVISKSWSGKAEDDNASWMEDDLLASAREVSHAAAVALSPRVGPGSTATLAGSTAAPSPAAPMLPATVPKAKTNTVLPRTTSKEEQQLLQVPGIGGETGNGLMEPKSAELKCLLEVVDRLQDTTGNALCKAMRAKVGEDQGSIEAVNRAVYATCAALIWHQGLGSDALALAERRINTPSKALTKTWRFGQHMRRYFDYGDVRDAVDSQMEQQRQQAIAAESTLRRNSSTMTLDDSVLTSRPILTRGPSVYQGAEEKVIKEVSERIVSRALFLLALPSQARRASTQDQSKRRWGLLAKIGSIGRTSSQINMIDGAELLERWKEVVDEATAMHKLKSILTYRRKAAEMRERAKKDSVAERIMRFVQSPAEVQELEFVRRCRDQRAQRRAEGLRLTRALVAAAASRPAKAWLLNSHAQSVRLTKRNERPGVHVHYLSCVEGCEPNAHLALTRQFALLVTASLDILKDCSRLRTGETDSEAAERRCLAVSALRALALDYDVCDHDILKGSILLEVLEPLLEGFDEPGANDAILEVDTEDPEDSCEVPTSAKTSSASQPDPLQDDDSSVEGGDYQEEKEVDFEELENALLDEFGDELELEEDPQDGNGLMPTSGEEGAVRRAAWSLFEVLLPRCVGLEGQSLETRLEEPTGFSHRLLDVLVRQVGRASTNVLKCNESLDVQDVFSSIDGQSHTHSQASTPKTAGVSTTPLPTETPLLKGGMRLRRDELGRAAAHREMGIRHSIVFWLRRDACPLDAEASQWFTPPKAGDIVARGPKWPLGNMMDGGPGGLGTIVSVMKSGMTVTVRWDVTGEQGKYKMGAVADTPILGDVESAPASVDDLLVWEVIKVDPSVGGTVIMKGGNSSLSEEDRSTPWSQFGLSLLGNGTLMYYGTSGHNLLFTLHSKHALQPDTWTHVAVVQAKKRCRIYIDGEEDGEARVPGHMLNPGLGMPRDVVESEHPYANNTDQLWEVSVVGAVSYSITFDPMTRTEANDDFVRFCKSADGLDEGVFGEERYSGGRGGSSSNWPGLGGRPPLIINAPSFVVHFCTDQSNFDWGFKLTSLACVHAPDGINDDNDAASAADLNPFPVYLGQPPSYTSSQRSASGFLWQASTFAGALTAEQVRSMSRTSRPPPEPAVIQEGACTDVLSLVQRCASSTDGAISQAGGLSLEAGASPLVSPQVLGPLLVLLIQGSLKLRLSAARLCEKLLPQAPPEMVQVQLKRFEIAMRAIPPELPHGMEIGASPISFVRALMLMLGQTLCVWAKPAASAVLDPATSELALNWLALGPSTSGICSKVSRVTGEEAFAVAGAHMRLLRALLANEGWSGALSDCIREACAMLPRAVKALETCTRADFLENEDNKTKMANAMCSPSLFMAHACFALLGGSFQGLNIGGEALALLGDEDVTSVERCTVVSMERPRPYYLKAKKQQAISKSTTHSAADFVVPAKEWEGLQTLGDAVVVCLHSEPERPRVLPRGRVSLANAPLPSAFLSALKTPPGALSSPLARSHMSSASVSSLGSSDGMSAAAQAAVAAMTAAGTPGLVPYVSQDLISILVEAFGVLSSVDATDKRSKHKPNVTVTDIERVLESPHPHEKGIDETFVLDFPGAQNIQLEFDESCRTEEGVAYISIYKDQSKTTVWGDHKFYGRDKDANWPGQNGMPAVCVPSSSCVIIFHAEDRNPDWGYRITARATCKEFTDPPERAPQVGSSALSLLQAYGAKALLSLMTSWPQFIPHALPLIKPLAHRALCDNIAHQGEGKTRSLVAQKLVLETEHPYAHNADRKELVKVNGARKLIVSFDERTRTEPGCDCMSIYTDETMEMGYGESKYTGGKDGHVANWPGMDGRPPLEIPAASFFFRWTTDGSVNDWGWKMTVTPVMSKVDPSNLSPPMLDSKLSSLLRICLDCPRDQPSAIGLENFEIEAHVPEQSTSLYENLGVPARGVDASPPRTPSRPGDGRVEKMEGGAGRENPWADVMKKTWPRLFVVNARDAEEVPLREEPRRDSVQVGQLSVSVPILVTGEEGDWLRVIPGPQHATPTAIDAARAQSATRATAVNVGIAEPATIAATTVAVAGRVGVNCAGQDFAESESEGLWVGDEEAAGAVWALRRQGDMLYMVPEEEALSHLVTLPDEGDSLDEDLDERRATTSMDDSTGTSTPFFYSFQVVDPPVGVEVGPISRGAFGVVPGEELAAESGRLWSALAETSRVTASRFSRLALTKILAGWEDDETPPLASGVFVHNPSPRLFGLDALGGPDMFLTLLRTIFAEERESKNETDAAALEVLSKKILTVAEGKTEEGCKITDMLKAFALHQLSAAASLASFLTKTKAVVRTWETSHNYADNVDSYSKICIPGAKRIRVVFDEKCSTEMGCDFVRLYKDSEHVHFWGEHKYHGPESNPSRVWAGVGSHPPLKIEADHFEIYFHSDSSNNDWGVRLSAYGIMQDPSVQQRAALRAKRKEFGRPETELACWLLEALAKTSNGHYGKSVMYREDTLVTLVRFLETADNDGKIWVVHLLAAMLQDVGKSRIGDEVHAPAYLGVANPAALLKAGGLGITLKRLAEKQAALEEDRGTAGRSPLLQALVQACVAAEDCLRRGAVKIEGTGTRSPYLPSTERKPELDLDDTGEQRWPDKSLQTSPYCLSTGRSRAVIAKSKEDLAGKLHATNVLAINGRHAAKAGGEIFRWRMRIVSCSGEGSSVGVGVGTPMPAGGSDDVSWLLTWSCDRTITVTTAGAAPISAVFGPKLKVDDVVTVELDPAGKTVGFYRNQAFVGLAFGYSGSGATLEYGGVSSARSLDDCWAADATLHAAVTLQNVGDAVALVSPPSATLTPPPLVAVSQELGGPGRVGGGSSGGEGEGRWLGLVRESLELMSAVSKRELPATFVAKDLLPKCQKLYAKTLESTHPLLPKPSERSVIIPGASALEVIFDKRTSMGLLDKITIFGDNSKDPERVLLGLEGGTESWSSSRNSGRGIALGDRVVRGPSWDWGASQDGGPGGYGTVVDIKAWKGKPRAGIKVLWEDTDFEGLYRWDHEGCFDLLVVGHGETSTKPILILGDSVNIRVDPDIGSAPLAADGGWKGTLQLRDRSYVSIKLPIGDGTLAMASAFTVEAWFLVKTLGTAQVVQGRSESFPLLSRSLMAGLSQLDIGAVPCSDQSMAKLLVQMHSGDQSSGLRIQGGALIPGKWTHVALSMSETGNATLVVDGQEVASGDFRGPRMELEDCDLAIGLSLETDQRLTAHIYDFRLWGKALSVTDITNGRKALPTRDISGLLANFPFDDDLRKGPRNRGATKLITAQLEGQCIFDIDVESPAPPSSSRWGWGCTVAPIYHLETLGSLPALQGEVERFRQVYCGGSTQHDLALVRYVNSFAEKKKLKRDDLLRKYSWEEMIPSEEDLVREPLLRELHLWPPPTATPTKTTPRETTVSTANTRGPSSLSPRSLSEPLGGLAGERIVEDVNGPSPVTHNETVVMDAGVEETKGELSVPQGFAGDGTTLTGEAGGGTAGAVRRESTSARKKETCVAARFEVLQNLNTKLLDALPYLDLCQMDRPWSAAALLSSCRGLIFRVVKDPVLDSALSHTAHRDGGQFDLKISRSKAARNIQAGRTDAEGRWSVFGQAFRQIHPMHPRCLRTTGKVYDCLLMGERAQDAGGPYRESWSMYAQELQSTALPLLIRVPNGKHAAGMGRDNYVPNPGATSPAQIEMFVFLGKLMGHSIRSKEYISLNLSGVVWKALVGQEVTREDLEGVDVLLTKSMQDIRTIHQKGVTRELFSDIVMETFTALSLDDREVELKPDGKRTPVTWDNRLEYADLVESHRLAECCSMVKYIRKGLSMVIPLAVLGMFTGEEVERMVCGKPEVDVDLLEAVTEYSGCRKDQPHIRLFWQALRDFTTEERSMLVKFTWGRTRLPLTAEGFSQRFKLQSFSRSPPDDYLPVAHTCFFSLELPAYSSLEVMKERLRNAIYNCQAIDGDDTFAGMQAAAMGWDWEEED